jgi:ketosteroid isomerase-like protein
MPKGAIVEKLPRSSAILAAGICFCISCVLFVLGCSSTQPPPAPPDTRAADEAAVRKADTDWSTAAGSKQVDSWVAFYTDDTVVLPPNDRLTSGKENIRKVVGELLMMPGLVISWQPTKVEVARSGDLAYSYGTYQVAFNDPKGKPVTDHGKYAEVWKKQPDGGWKCILDTWSSDLPAAPPSK